MAFQRYLSGPATATCRGANDAGDITGCAGDLMAVFTGIWMPKDIQSHSAWNFIVKLSVYLFPVVAVISSIPVFSIVIKYNCIENGWRECTAFLWGVVFPWVVAIPLLYQPDALLQF